MSEAQAQSEAHKIVVLAGPNGAGKSTTAAAILRETFYVGEFVNADQIAAGLSGFAPETVAIAAGRIMLARIAELARQKIDFGFETTLAARSFAPWLRRQIEGGYAVHLVFLSLPSPEVAIARVAERVRAGGHNVPEATIRRRYVAGLRNFFELYRPLSSTWQLLDNNSNRPRMIACGSGEQTELTPAPDLLKHLKGALE